MSENRNIDFTAIRPVNGSRNSGFEEFICQLARRENPVHADKYEKCYFVRNGTPDGGLECYWTLENSEDDKIEWGFQAKYFTSSLGSSEWGQVNESVERFLDTHPKLIMCTIALSYDLPDPRNDGTITAREKWDEYVVKWTELAGEKGMSVDFQLWSQSDLIDKMNMHEGLYQFWFNKEEFTEGNFISHNEKAISYLGGRYSEELNVDLPVKGVFNYFLRKGTVNKELRLAVKEISNLWSYCPQNDSMNDTFECKEIFAELQKICDDILDFVSNMDLSGVMEINIQCLNDYVNSIDRQLGILDDLYESNKNYDILSNYHYTKGCNKFIEFKQLICSEKFNLINEPYLVIQGEAGVGKSHLLADVIKEMQDNNQYSLLFLGQHFVSNIELWNQLIGLSPFNNMREDNWLEALAAKAEMSRKRIILFIDAINEGAGHCYWKGHINGLIYKIKNYPWLGLVLSVRQSYYKSIFSDNSISDVVAVQHVGSAAKYIEMVTTYFNYYKIDLPNTPQLEFEFNNPMFLKTFCECVSRNNDNYNLLGSSSIDLIFEAYIKIINEKLSDITELNFDPSINVVGKCVEKICEAKLVNQDNRLLYENAYLLCKDIADMYCNQNQSKILSMLCAEGLVFKNMLHDGDEYVFINYNRMEDYLVAKLLISKEDNIEKIPLTKDILRNQGLLESLSVLIPEVSEYELYDLYKEEEYKYCVEEAFLSSLKWRKNSAYTEKTLEIISIVIDTRYYKKFQDIMLKLSLRVGCRLNAEFLHRNLFKLNFNQRDRDWTLYINRTDRSQKSSDINIILDWVFAGNCKGINDDQLQLYAYVISWLLTSSNRKLRDDATRALVKLLDDRTSLVLWLLKEFENINDIYVIERLYAVAYGVVLRADTNESLKELCEYVFENVFNKDEVTPHIVLRDYAQGVIEYAEYKKVQLDFDINLCRPPYKSQWYDAQYINKTYDKHEKLSKDKNYEFRGILWSCKGGDFSNYIIGLQYNHDSTNSKWTGISFDDTYQEFIEDLVAVKFSHEQIEMFKKINGYIEDCDGDLIDYGYGMILPANDQYSIDEKDLPKFRVKTEAETEASLQKFISSLTAQQLQFYNDVVAPNIKNNNLFDSRKHFDLYFASKAVFIRAIEMGWSKKFFGNNDKYLDRLADRAPKAVERMGKKYQWIAYYEFMAKLSDKYRMKPVDYNSKEKFEDYKGLWQHPHMRDIDPTVVYYPNFDRSKLTDCESLHHKIPMNDTKPEDWIKDDSDIQNIDQLLEFKFEDSDWLATKSWGVLNDKEFDNSEDRYREPYKELFVSFNTVVVKSDDVEHLKKYLTNEPRDLRNCINRENHNIYVRECYWSEAYKYHNQMYEDYEKETFNVNENEYMMYPFSHNMNSDIAEYAAYDSAVICIPSNKVFTEMDLAFSNEYEGYFLNQNNETIMLCPSTLYNSEQEVAFMPNLAVNKKFLVEWLETRGYRIVWPIWGYKDYLQLGNHDYDERYRRRCISGYVCLDDNNELESSIQLSLG